MTKKNAILSKDEAQSLVRELVQGCVDFGENTLSPARDKATRYYKGEPFGNEKPGRSQAIVTEVRDQVRGVVPSFMRVIFGPERVVEFRPRGKDSEAQSRNQTDCVQYVFAEDNPGFMETLSVVKDGLIRRLGAYKFWWIGDERIADSYPFMTEAAYNELAARADVTISRAIKKAGGGYGTVEYTTPKPGYVCVRALKPEQVLFNALARDEASAMFIGHQEDVTRGELVAMGYSDKFIDQFGQRSRTLDTNPEMLERVPNNEANYELEAGDANKKMLYIEGYARIDLDGDGVQELRKLCMVGPGFEIANGDGLGEVVDHIPMVFFCPDPEPHTLNGHSLADIVMDLQLTESTLVRAMLDSLSMSIFPRTAFVEGQANVKDIMNTEVGATIRERAPGMVREFVHTFVGREALGVLEFYRSMGERRTGQSNGANDLDLDALQSTTKSGVDAAISGSQAQTELMVRIFAEMALKPLFKGIAHVLKKNQTESREVKVRGRWVKMQPSEWKETEVTVAVALGAMLPEKKLEILNVIKQTQEGYLTTMGPQNPIVTLSQLSNTLHRAIELSGFPDGTEFFNVVDPNWAPPPPPAPEPSPEMVVAQIEQQKVQNQQAKDQATLQLKAQELQLKAEEMQQKMAFDVRKLESDAALARMELELKYQTTIETAKLDAEVKAAAHRDRLALDREMGAQRLALDTKGKEHAAILAEDAHTHGQQVAEHGAQLEESAQSHAETIAERKLAGEGEA